MIKIQIIFPDLSEDEAAGAMVATAAALAGGFVLRELLVAVHKPVFEVRLDDPALPNMDGQSYEVTVGLPARIEVKNTGGAATRAESGTCFWLEPIGAPGQTWGPFDTELSASEFLDQHPTADDTTHKIVPRHSDGSWDGSWAVIDGGTVVNGRVPLLGRFPSEQEASEFISTLPDYLSGRYGIDGPPE